MALWVSRAIADARRGLNCKLRVSPTAEPLSRHTNNIPEAKFYDSHKAAIFRCFLSRQRLGVET